VNSTIGIGDLVALVTVAGLAVYVLGLVGLTVSIRLGFTTDVSVAWYAVSLLSRTVVAGQGVRIWLGWPIILTAIVLPGTLIIRSGPFLGSTLLVIGIVVVVAFVDIFFRAPAFMVRGLSRSRQRASFTESVKLSGKILAGSLVMGLGSFVMILAASVITRKDLALLGDADVTSGNVLVGVLLLFFGGFIVGLPVAAGVSPPLPRVKITRTQPEDAKGNISPSLEGYLVTHANGFWHLFDKNNELLAIPDEQVLEVRIVEKGPSKRPRLWNILWKA
jgi:hypothetical protein